MRNPAGARPPAHRTGLSRREVLQVGYSGLLGLGLSNVLTPRAAAAGRAGEAGKARSVLLVLLTGGPSQLDTFDLKPDAPAEVRGEFKPIRTNVPGVEVCEHLPRLAARFDRLALVRSFSHTEYNHLPGTHRLLTGSPMPSQRGSDLDNVLSRRDWPCYAAGLSCLRPRADGVPSGVTLPNPLIEGPLTWPGQHAGFLGPRHDPWQLNQDPNAADFRVDSVRLPDGFGVERLRQRRALLGQFDRARRDADGNPLAPHQQRAFDLLTSGKVAQAFALDREPDTLRDRYGRHRFGQSLLLARRLIEAGVPVIQANMGIVQTWDTHANHFPRLKGELLPALDQGLSALLDDLAARGLLEETLVVVAGEFGRTPKMSLLPGNTVPGRDHWAAVYSGLFAGAGIRGGQVIGRSDKKGAFPVTTPFTPADVGATVYVALGIDPGSEVRDVQGRPVRINGGQVMRPLYTGAGA